MPLSKRLVPASVSDSMPGAVVDVHLQASRQALRHPSRADDGRLRAPSLAQVVS